MDKRGISGGTVIVILAVLVAAYFFVPQVHDFVGSFGGGSSSNLETPGNCPSSGLTEVTLNTQKALAATATNADVSYYVFDKTGSYVTSGKSSAGQATFDVKCAVGKKYDLMVINETVAVGSYGQQVEVDASESTVTKNLQMYAYGDINLVSVASSTDPLGNSNISAGVGKTCGFTVTFNVNESASGFNKPLIMCQANTSSVTSVDMSGVNDADAKAPTRLSPATGYKYYSYEMDKMLKSTDPAQKVSGTITFSQSITPAATDYMTCIIVDQAMWKKANYQTLGLTNGFVTSTENSETNSDVGAPDASPAILEFGGAGTNYC